MRVCLLFGPLSVFHGSISRRMEGDQQVHPVMAVQSDVISAAEKRARLGGLLAEAAAWKNAALIREFVEARMAQAKEPAPEIEAWARWARDEADRIDPLAPDASSP